jgi:hypothetical protein
LPAGIDAAGEATDGADEATNGADEATPLAADGAATWVISKPEAIAIVATDRGNNIQDELR